MTGTTQYIGGAVAVVLLLGILIGGPVACAISDQREATKRVEATCTGDLKSDPVRAAACMIAATNARQAGR